MTSKTDGERLERVETNLENLTKAFEVHGKLLQDIRDAQLLAVGTSASKDYVDTKVSGAATALELKITSAKRRNTITVWVSSTLSAILGAVLMGLVTYFVTNIGRN